MLLLLVCWLLVDVSCFFFKQKTAYEMRISDWSSDVCSSDLEIVERGRGRAREHPQRIAVEIDHAIGQHEAVAEPPQRIGGVSRARLVERHHNRLSSPRTRRSEEHTSELQSLMRISYAVFCLKKKKTNAT